MEMTNTTLSVVSTVSDFVVITANAVITTRVAATRKRCKPSSAAPSALSAYGTGLVVSTYSRVVSLPQVRTTTLQVA